MSNCSEIFEHEGTSIEVAGNKPLYLNEADHCWLVSEGRIDLFAAVARAHDTAAQRIHLCQLEPGDLIAGGSFAADKGLGLVAVGAPGSKVRQLPRQRLRELAGDAESAKQAAQLLDHWIDQLTSGARDGQIPRDVKMLVPNVEMRLPAGASISPKQVLWISGDEVHGEFMGQVQFELGDACFPLADLGWLSVVDVARLKGAATDSVLGDDRMWAGLDQFHTAIVDCARVAAEKADAVELRRLREKARMENETSRSALYQLAAAVQTGPEHEVAADPGEDPTLAACRLVGQSAGIAITAPRDYAEKQWSDPVTAIARSSAVRTRGVVLSGNWWREENGPLLGFLADGNHPVALLPSASGYVMIDPRAHTSTPVTSKNRSDIQGTAYCFYRSFPPRKMTPRDVFQFGLLGTRRDWIMVVVLGVAGAVLGLFVPIATGWIIGDIIPSGDRGQLALLVMALGVNSLVTTLFGFCQGIAVLRLESRMDASVEAGVWDRLLNLPASFFRQYTAGDLSMRAMGISQIRQTLTDAAMSSVLSFLFSLVAFILLFYYDARLAAFAVLLFILVILATAVGAYFQLQYERRNYEVSGRVSGILLQLLTGISRLRVAGAENRALAFWAKNYSEQTKLAYRGQLVSNNLATFMSAVPVFSTLVIFSVVAMYPPGTLSLATFLAFSAAFASIMSSAVEMSSTISSALDVVPLYERSRPILETAPEFHRAKRDPGELSGNIEIGHVSFRYDPESPLVLENVSIEIKPGEFVAFVGPSGAGKSTILRLLLGFEVPETGSIYYDREDLSQLDHQAVRRQMGAVLQNSRLTSGDIFRNIIGSSSLTLEDAWEAARLSGLDEDIKAMPMGMHTVISDGESTLSGGQRQRLMIARAIVNKPAILLFDEATSALDNVTQEKVARSLDSLKSTRVVIAHRLSTIVNADRICVLDQGRIVQEGTYDELMQQDGLFAELARRQLM